MRENMQKLWQWLQDRKSNTVRRWRSSLLRVNGSSDRLANGNVPHSYSAVTLPSENRGREYEEFFEEPQIRQVLEVRRRSFREPRLDQQPVPPPDVDCPSPNPFLERLTPTASPRGTPARERSSRQIRFNLPEVRLSSFEEEEHQILFEGSLSSPPPPIEVVWSPVGLEPADKPPPPPFQNVMASAVELSPLPSPTSRRNSANERARQNLLAQRRQSNVQIAQAMTGRRASTTIIPLTSAQIHLVRSLWRQIYTSKGPTVIGTSIYHRLCFKCPVVKEQIRRVELPPNFRDHDTFIKAHSKAMAELIDQVVENLDQLDNMTDELIRIGRVHARVLRGELTGKIWNVVAETFIDCTLEWGDKSYNFSSPLTMSTMSSFPLSTIDDAKLTTAILGKLPFKESTRMRRTCRQMEETITQANMTFPLERTYPISYSFIIYLRGNAMEDTHIEPCLLYSCPRSAGKVQFLDWSHGREALVAPARSLQGAIFDQLSISAITSGTTRLSGICRLLPYLEESKIRARTLRIFSSDIDNSGISLLAKYLHPRKIHLKNCLRNSESIEFSLIKEMSTEIECREIEVYNCEEFPPGYESTLSQFKIVHFAKAERKSMPSLVPLIRLWLSDSSSPLEHFELPYYNREAFLTSEEVEELDLEQWRIRRNEEEDGFVIETDKEYITLTGRPSYSPAGYRDDSGPRCCIGHRTPKTDIVAAVSHWVDVFTCGGHQVTVPFDASDLFDKIVDHRDDFQMVKDCIQSMSTLVPSNYSY